jgi:hypothetical protein
MSDNIDLEMSEFLKIGIVREKLKRIIEFINVNKLRDELLKTTTSNCKFKIEVLVLGLCIKDHFNFSANKYTDYIKTSKIKLPSESRLRQFKKKLKKYKIFKQIYDEYISLNPELVTDILLIDSSFIPNQNSNTDEQFIGRNSYYNNKFGSKITTVNSVEGFILYFQIDSSNEHDAVLGKAIINSISNEKINGHKLLADSGYDSSIFKEQLKSKNCEYIIPKNKRNAVDEKLKEEINKEIEIITTTMKNNKKQKRDEIKNLKKNKPTMKNKTKIEITKIKADTTIKINNLKKEIKELTNANKLEISKTRAYLKQKFKKETKKAIKNKTKKKEFNIGLTDEQKIIYKKRANVEHPYKFLKKHRIDTVKWKSKSMFINEVYSSLIDMIIFREKNKTKLKQ